MRGRADTADGNGQSGASAAKSRLDIFGVLMTMYDKRTQLARQVAEDVQNVFGEKMFGPLFRAMCD
jgi:cellulose biosynthesis protein BcsQ